MGGNYNDLSGPTACEDRSPANDCNVVENTSISTASTDGEKADQYTSNGAPTSTGKADACTNEFGFGTSPAEIERLNSCASNNELLLNEDDLDDCLPDDIWAEHQKAKEMIAAQEAKICQLNRHLEILLDENNLLNLELQDVQTTSSKLEGELEYAKNDISNLRNRLGSLKLITKELTDFVDIKFGEQDEKKITISMALSRLWELIMACNAPDLDDESGILGWNAGVVGASCSGISTSAASANNEQTNDTQLENPASVQPSVPDLSSVKMEQAVPLRRSQRKSVIASQVKLEMPIPMSPAPSDVSKKDAPGLSNATGAISPENADETENDAIHAVDSLNTNGHHCVCGREYLTKQKLNVHIRQQTEEWKFICKTCGLKYFEAFKLKRHMKRAHGEDLVGSHGCYFCGEIFTARRELFAHQKTEHNCGPFTRHADNTVNTSKRLSKNGKAGKCIVRNTGGRTFKKNALFRKQKLAKPTKCETGSKLARTLAKKALTKRNKAKAKAVNNSTVAHKIDPSKDGFYCICGNNFTSKSGLNVHVNYFTYEAKFACSECERKFFSTGLLRDHMKSKHDMVFAGREGCRRCGLCFPSRLLLYQHCKIVHKCGPLMVNTKEKPASPDPELPVLEREDVPNNVKDDIAASGDNMASPRGKGFKKGNVPTFSVRAGKPKIKTNFTAVQRKKAGNPNKLNARLKKKEKALVEEANHDSSSTVAPELETNDGIQVTLQNTSKRTPVRRRKTPTKFKNNEFQTETLGSARRKTQTTPKAIPPPNRMSKPAKPTVTEKKRNVKLVKSSHQATVKTKKGLEIKCKCGKVFTTSSALRSHVRLKTRGNVYKCNVCPEAFPRRDYLRRHLLIEHGIILKNIRGTSATVTDKPSVLHASTLKGNKDANSRKKTILHGVPKQKSKGQIKCLCGMTFMRETTLREHLRLKIGKKVFKCDLCPESFSRHDYFKDHVKRAHELTVEGMACRDCGARGFPSPIELREHRLKHHANKKTKKDAA